MVEAPVDKWIIKAEKDLSDAEFNLANGRYEVAAFLAHQAAEKALKALYILKFKRLWKIHDLKELAVKVDAPKEIIKIGDALNPHYIQTRYPVEVTYDEELAEEAVENAKKVVEWIKKKLKK
jgi:HEPN domain-containing protein